MSSFPVFANLSQTLKIWAANMKALNFERNMTTTIILTGVADGDILGYDGAEQKWTNRALLRNSLSERKTGRKTYDGRDIYIKELDLGVLPNATNKNVAHNIAGTVTVEAIYGRAVNSGAATTLPLPHPDPDANESVSVVRIGANIRVQTRIDFSSYTGRVQIEYTRE